MKNEKNKKSLNIDKKEFFELYKKVKSKEIDINTLDQEKKRRILIMIREEVNINSKKIDEKFSELNVSTENIKIYNKEIELLKKEY